MDLQALIQHIHAANAANQRGDHATALKHCRLVLKAHPEVVEAWYHQGIAWRGQGRRNDAIDSQKKVASLSPDSADAQNAAGLELIELGAADDAERCLNRALALTPNHVYALSNLAKLRQMQRRYDEAEPLLQRAIALQPGFAPFHANLGAILNKQTRYVAAEQVLQRAVALDPDMAEAWNNLANACSGQRKFAEAEAAYRRALARQPDLLESWSNLADILREMRRYGEAAQAYDELVKRAPGYDFARGRLLYSLMQCCDWRRYDELRSNIDKDLRKQRKVADPFGYQAVSDSTVDLLACARTYAREFFPPRPNTTVQANPAPADGRIRIGYVSGEFHTQATAILMAGLYEHHDKSRFSITAFDNGESDQGEWRSRLEGAFDEFVRIGPLTDEEATQAVADRQIDILVNLNGYFGRGRQGVFSRRASPIQVNYLGFPGTLGADYMDYLIADRTVIPEEQRADYLEKIAWLPDCYQANDNRRPCPPTTISRAEAGLPDDAFVFCCFNNSYKITPARFALWMRILGQVDGAVLWLLEDNATASANLRAAAAAQGIAPERLIFAQRVSPNTHLARHRLADLFVDSLPYNAHTTASDALWAGLPVVTQIGRTFPGRVAASLLRAIDLPELITDNETDYAALAVALARDPERLRTIRQRLDQNRLQAPLFDTARFTRHIEAAFQTMHERRLAGLPPAHFEVTPR